MAVAIALDAGTTGVRAFAVNEQGAPIDVEYREFTQFFPQSGWVEHDAEEIWLAIAEATRQLIERVAQPVAAIGITNQRETVVAWDRRTGKPLHRAIVWQDRRTAARCTELTKAGHLHRIRHTTGLVLDPYFSASKIEWLRTAGGVSLNEYVAVGTIDSWLLWNLTGGSEANGAVHATDPSNASRTMLLDLSSQSWSPELCDLFGIPLHCLGTVQDSAGVFGTTHPDGPLPPGIPIAGIAGDQQSALFGQACFWPGMSKNTYGTGSFVLMNVGETLPPPTEGLLTTIAWSLPRQFLESGGTGTITHFALEGSIFATGAAIQWLRDGLEIIDQASEIGPLASSVDSSEGVVLVPAFAGLGSPYWDPYARGAIFGLSRGSSRAHIARATVDSMAFQTRDVIDAMTEVGGLNLTELRIDGGASVMDLLMTLVADQLQTPVVRPKHQDTTALGAAYLAGLGAGVWSSMDEVAANWEVEARVMPTASRAAADSAYALWQRAVDRSRAWEPQD